MLRAALISLLILVTAVLALLAAGWFALTYRVEGPYIDSDGVRLHYTDDGAGEPVILLHGFAVNGDLNWRWSGILGRLAQEFRVIALDLRGHGLSDKPRSENAYGEAMITDVVRLMDHLQIQTAHLVGYSLGGFLVLRFAVDHPQRLRSAALIGAGWESPNDSAFLAAIPKLQRDLREGHSIGPLSEYLEGRRAAPSLLHSWSVHLMTGYFNDPLALASLLGGLPALSVREDELSRVRSPVLAIVGEHDPFRPSAAALCGRLRDYRMRVVDGVDHVRLAGREETKDTLLRFLIAPDQVLSQCPAAG